MYIVVDTVYTGWYVYSVEYYVMMTILHYTRQNLYTIHYTVIKRDRTLKSCNQPPAFLQELLIEQDLPV